MWGNICSLLKGVHNERFPQSKYLFIWDAEKVINYMSTINSTDFSIKILTLKLTMLLALISSARAHEIQFLETRFLVKHHSCYSFHFGKPTKAAKPGKLRVPLEFSHFQEDLNLCVCNHIDLYLDRTSSWRTKEKKQFLLSYINPHNGVSSSTVSRWIVEMLSLSGIDTDMFKGHSTRSASSSKASVQGVPLQEILKRGHWSNKTTFEKIYKKDVSSESSVGSFEKAILKAL